MDFQEKLQNYAALAIRMGVHLQPQQELVISSPIECAHFARMLQKEAFLAGAKDVYFNWNDEKSTLTRYTYANKDAISNIPPYLVDGRMYALKRKAAFISIAAEDPTLMAAVDPEKLQAGMKASSLAFKEWGDALSANECSWCVISVPTQSWADQMFPNSPCAVDQLWEAIFQTVRIDRGDPVAAWEAHIVNLKRHAAFLNAHQFTALHYVNGIGTDLMVGMPEDYVFTGASEFNQDGVEFVANMPTEEVFSAPHKDRVNGTVVSALPLCFQGNLIENFKLRFVDGKVVEYSAEKGGDILKSILEADEESCMLGEVALVPIGSPISKMGKLFFNTLFDENASCHFALGSAYPSCVRGTQGMEDAQLRALGLNTSMMHVDFMVGTADLCITGICKNGEEVKVFEKGEWAD